MRDSTEQRKAERRENTTNALLELFAKITSRKEYLDAVVEQIRGWSGCRCVGIRVLNQLGEIPYESYVGFSQEFWESENWLSLGENQCACTRVITGNKEPQDASTMTPAGSFRCDSTIKFIGELAEEKRARFRGVCVKTGFASVAIVPIRYREEILGAIHLADEREGKVPLNIVEFIESMAPLIGEAIHRFNVEEELQRNYDTQTIIASLLSLSQENIPLEDLLKRALDLILSIPWLAFKSKGSIFLVEDDPEVLVMKAQSGLAEPIQKECARIPFGRCLCGRAALTEEIQFADCLDDRHETLYEGITPHGHYCVPIISASKKVVGVINLYLKEGHRRDEREGEFLRTITDVLMRIIEHKQAEETLRQSQQNYEALVNSVDGIVWEADGRTFQFSFVSQQAERLLGYPVERWLTEPTFWKDHIHPDDREWATSFCVKATTKKIPHEFEYRMIAADGRTVWLRDIVTVVVENDQPVKLRGVMIDITERKKAEKVLLDKKLMEGKYTITKIMTDIVPILLRVAKPDNLKDEFTLELMNRIERSLYSRYFPSDTVDLETFGVNICALLNDIGGDFYSSVEQNILTIVGKVCPWRNEEVRNPFLCMLTRGMIERFGTQAIGGASVVQKHNIADGDAIDEFVVTPTPKQIQDRHED